MEKKKLILFDLDGTLCDSLEDLTDAVNHMRTEFGLGSLTMEQVRQLVGEGAANLVRGALPGKSPAELRRGLENFIAYNSAHIADKTMPYPGVRETLAILHDQGRQMAVVSNKAEALCRKLLAELALDRYFIDIVGGDTLPLRKPYPDPLLKVMADAGIPAGEAVMVGDSIHDLQAGKAAAVTTIACLYGYGNENEIKSADMTIDSFSRLLALPL
ncbi:HAD-IA family hydrolase [Geotalea sp. SG265]|uniref:HAD family hydrolase n=1 Tax=Geotalea sp. SG265 TaxID=2922867 RepID=UPI001FAEC3F9|nr:HAD-IA family hydrolase [Geotalea sp. SG265]